MIIKETKINGVYLLDFNCYNDNRGGFFKPYLQSFFKKQYLNTNWKEIFTSFSFVNTVRGLHYHGNTIKLIYPVTGTINDILIDLRSKSPTFGVVEKIMLTYGLGIYCESGIAHGFEVIDGPAIVNYCMSEEFNPNQDFGINILPFISPTLLKSKKYIISEKDKNLPDFETYKKNPYF